MKIGILTLPLHTNYGGILQAYALQTVLERMGHEVRLIGYKKPFMSDSLYRNIRHSLSPIKRFVLENLTPDILLKDTSKYTRRFITKWINIDYYSSINKIPSDYYDVIVVGSDQIWRKLYVEMSTFLGKIETSYLDFAKDWDIKRISYAASFGTDEWEYSVESTKKCEELIQLFDAVSVREYSGIELCRKYLNHEAVQLLDPTMLLNREDYLRLISKRTKKRQGIMTYILDEDNDKLSIVEKIKVATGKNVFKSNVSYNDIDSGKRGAVQPPVEHWLQAFDDADFVITDSFHACVFSLIFNKPFIVIPNKERGASRFHSLLSIFNQEHRMIDANKKFELLDNILATPNCDIAQYREKSINYLKSNLQ